MPAPVDGEPRTRQGRVRRRDAAVRRLRRVRVLTVSGSVALCAGFAAVAYAVTPGRTDGSRPRVGSASPGGGLGAPGAAPGPFGSSNRTRHAVISGGS